ncbi:MAG: anti-sigma factor [Bradyrhizobium sp.]|nr:anti-sigma factor [Bradyrhizobium sp.]
MEYSEDHIALAAEYALGTLDAEERAQVEAMMSVDPDYIAVVRAWEFRLGVLNQMVGSVEPPADLWERIRTAVGLTGQQQAPLELPEPPPIAPAFAAIEEAMAATAEHGFAAPEPPPPPPVAVASPLADETNVVRLERRVRSYRKIAMAMTAIAAVLLAIIGVQVASPGLLPGLGGKPVSQVAEMKPPPAPAPAPTLVPSAQYVALLQGAAGGPAFILTVDGATKNFTVRKVGAPPIDSSKNYELWLISDRLQNRPRSLGVIGTSDFTARPVLAGYDTDVINGGTYAVTVEQSGGSPDGSPHSQPVFIGKLIETVPPATPSQNR